MRFVEPANEMNFGYKSSHDERNGDPDSIDRNFMCCNTNERPDTHVELFDGDGDTLSCGDYDSRLQLSTCKQSRVARQGVPFAFT